MTITAMKKEKIEVGIGLKDAYIGAVKREGAGYHTK